MKQAFLIGAYKNPDYLKDLILSLLNDQNYIFVHINRKNKDVFDCLKERFQHDNRVSIFCEYSISWGGIGLLNSMLFLIRKALLSEAEYFHFITGQDILVRNLDELHDFCVTHKEENFLDLQPLYKEWTWRYYEFHLYDRINAFSKLQMKIEGAFCKIQRIFKIKRKKLPFEQEKAGSGWWSLNRDAVEYMSKHIDDRLLSRLKWTFAPDELVFQCVLYNSPLRDSIVGHNLCYIDWSHIAGSPKTLVFTDYSKIISSNMFFARKIDPILSKDLIEKINTNRYKQ